LKVIPIIIACWFGLSVFFAVTLNFMLHSWLCRMGRLKFFDPFAGVPGYLDRIYVRWCEDNGRNHKTLIGIRRVSFISFVLSSIAFIFIF
jgi:hypothetical protein